jgi:SAM-dependent methyltransferase
MTLTIKAALKKARDFASGGTSNEYVNPYYNSRFVKNRVTAGMHRHVIGGLWEELGNWQFELLKTHGLQPFHRLLDIGCGSFRGGVKFVSFLDAGNYYGFDLNKGLLDAGYAREIRANGLATKLPKENLCVTDDFSCEEFGGNFDFAIAVSVFSHLSLNHWRIALERLAPQIKSGGQLFATYFPCPEDADFASPIKHNPSGVISYPARDPYHCRASDIVHLAKGLPWEITPLEKGDHPRGQRVLRISRI